LVALCQNRFSTHGYVTYEDFFFKFLELHNLHNRRRYFDALFFISVYFGLKRCPSLLDITDIQVFPRSFRNSSLFSDACENCPSAGRVSAANRVYKNVDISMNPLLPSNKFCANQ
jgi:hypothetical protein